MTSSLRPTDPPTFDITNLGQGQVIQVAVRPPLGPGSVEELEQQLQRLVERRQPRELRIVLPPGTTVGAEDLRSLRRSLEEVGGTLTIAET